MRSMSAVLAIPLIVGAVALAGCGGGDAPVAGANDTRDLVEQTLKSAAGGNAMNAAVPGADAAAFVDAAGATPAFLFFDATWCHQQCAALRSQVYSYLRDFSEHNAMTRRVDIDEGAALAERFGVTQVPTLLRIEGGKVTKRRLGAYRTLSGGGYELGGVWNFYMY